MKNNTTVLLVLAALLGVGILILPNLQPLQPNPQQQDFNNNWPQTPPNLQPQPPARPAPPPNVGGYMGALNAARQQNKNLLIIFEADWCRYCKRLKNETLSDPRVKQEMNQYIVYNANFDREKNLVNKYRVEGIPTYVIADSSERIKKQGDGFKSPSSFIRWMKTPNLRPDLRRPDARPNPRPPRSPG